MDVKIHTYLIAGFLFFSNALYAQTNQLPAPRGVEADITRILSLRQNTDTFATNGLPRQAISDLLWASTGINRPATGHRTSNYSFKSRDNDIYLLCAQGVFVYDQIEHALIQKSDEDLRSMLPAPADSAPATLALVTRNGSPTFFGAIHVGFNSENVSLACADIGLGSRISATIPAALPAALELGSGHYLFILQTLGYPLETDSFAVAWSVTEGPLVAANVSETPILKMLKRRRSTRSFSSSAFSDQTLGELLWAGMGVNQSNTLERTSPLIADVHDIDIYVALADGVYRYLPAFGAAHAIERVSEADIRGTLGYGSVPAIFIYVADYAKLSGTSSEKQRAACLHAGLISQNIAAYAAAEGIGELVRSSVSVPTATLGLRADQTPLFTQTLGYPASAPGASAISFVADGGGSVVGATSQQVAFGSNCTSVVAIPENGLYFSHWSGLPGGRVVANPIELNDVTCPITVTAAFINAPQTYAGWASAYFNAAELTNSGISGAAADPEQCGLSNFKRYAFGLPARGPASFQLAPVIETNGTETSFTFSFSRRTNACNLCYELHSSSNLTNWTPYATYLPGEPADITIIEPIDSGSSNSPPQQFLRLRATAP